MKGKYIYDIFLNEVMVGDSGDEIFDTENEALADAHDYIISYLADEFKKQANEFEIQIYEATAWGNENVNDSLSACLG